MPSGGPPVCLLISPEYNEDSGRIFEVVQQAAAATSFDWSHMSVSASEPFGEDPEAARPIADADIVLADLTTESPAVYAALGLAASYAKPTVVIYRPDSPTTRLVDIRSRVHVPFRSDSTAVSTLTRRMRNILERFRIQPRDFRVPLRFGSANLATFDIRIEDLEPREFENLCFELLLQLGYQKLEWDYQRGLIDALSTLPKKDPDGHQYEELWAISMGLRAPGWAVIREAMTDPLRFIESLRVAQSTDLRVALERPEPVTLLVIDREAEPGQLERVFHEMGYLPHEVRSLLRLRLWDRATLTHLVGNSPQLAIKYFSDRSRAQSTTRKSLDELYVENTELTERLRSLIAERDAEREARLAAERDAIWKELSFKAAHKLGNPIFAIETGLSVLLSDADENSPVVGALTSSIEKAKNILTQFKSITAAEEVHAIPTDIRELVEASSQVAIDSGFDVKIVDEDAPLALADPQRLGECLDELFRNAITWCNRSGSMHVVLEASEGERVPDAERLPSYVKISIEDDGPGVPPEDKDEIFDPFFTSSPHGTGLGLAIVRAVIDGHRGVIWEDGTPGEGARFNILLPSADRREEEG